MVVTALMIAQVGAIVYQFLPFFIALVIGVAFVCFIIWMQRKGMKEPWPTVFFVGTGIVLLIVLAKCAGVW